MQNLYKKAIKFDISKSKIISVTNCGEKRRRTHYEGKQLKILLFYCRDLVISIYDFLISNQQMEKNYKILEDIQEKNLNRILWPIANLCSDIAQIWLLLFANDTEETGDRQMVTKMNRPPVMANHLCFNP